jgi:hypothetical protein
LLKSSRVDVEVNELLSEVPHWVDGARVTLAGDEPCVDVGEQCDDPFECPFKAYCMRNIDLPEMPDFSLDVLYRMSGKKKEELRGLGYHDARRVPARYLNETQLMIQKASKLDKPKFDQRVAKQAMASLSYPRYYLDFETMAFASHAGQALVLGQHKCHFSGLATLNMSLQNCGIRSFLMSLGVILAVRLQNLLLKRSEKKGQFWSITQILKKGELQSWLNDLLICHQHC